MRKILELIFPWRYQVASLNKKLDDILNILKSSEIDKIHNDKQRLLEIQKALNSKNNELLEKIQLLNSSINSKIHSYSGKEKFNDPFDKNTLRIPSVSNDLISSIEKIFDNQFQQLESLLLIYKLLPNTKLLPATRGWAGSPDFLAKVAELILKKKPHFVVEASSGVSSVVIGQALKINKVGKAVSFEHEERFATATRDNLLFNELQKESRVIFSPLTKHLLSDKNWLWYDLNMLKSDKKIDMLIVDGPPGKTQELARYPAVPLLLDQFADDVTIVLDDTNRMDESEIVGRWVDLLESEGFNVSVTELNGFEKGMVIFELSRF